MISYFIFLIKVSIGIGIISIPYYFFLRNDTNLLLKRFYLIAGVLISWLLPLITIQRPEIFTNLTSSIFIDPSTKADGVMLMSSIADQVNEATNVGFGWLEAFGLLYALGMSLLFINNIRFLLKWRRRSKIGDKQSRAIVYTDFDHIFSLFFKIYLPKSLKDAPGTDSILKHEEAHINQLHFIDLLIMEFTLLLTWFNPFTWLISRMIKENHEFLADREVLSTGVNGAHYRAQLVNQTLGVKVFRLGNQFNHSLTTKRFQMMKKKNANRMGILKYLLLFPSILLTMGLSVAMDQSDPPIKGKVVFAETGSVAAGASIIIKGSSKGTVSDMDGAFEISADMRSILLISYVGYYNVEINAYDVANGPIQLRRQTYNMDPEYRLDNSVRVIGYGKRKKNSTSIDPDEKMDEQVTVIGYGKRKKNATPPQGERLVIKNDDPDEKVTFYVDGELVEGIDHIHPDDIESISVLKGDKAKELFDVSSGGVIVLKTKKKQTGDEEVFVVVEDNPSFEGGKPALHDYIYSNLKYPEKAVKEGLEGEVQVRFTVKAHGGLSEFEVIQSSDEIFNMAALAVFKDMPKWKPAKQRGKAVETKVIVPVRFKLNGK